MRIILVGYAGHMGREVRACAEKAGYEIVAAVDFCKECGEQQRHAPEVHLRAGIDGEFCHKIGRYFLNQIKNAPHPLVVFLIKLVVERGRYNCGVEFHFGCHRKGLAAFVILHRIAFEHRIKLHNSFIFNWLNKKNGATSAEAFTYRRSVTSHLPLKRRTPPLRQPLYCFPFINC